MFSFGTATRPEFGGLGVMIEPPNVGVTISPAATFRAHGALADRAARFVETLVRKWELPAPPNCEIEVHSPVDHTGLGVGTQLGLAVAAGLRRYLGLPELAVESLAMSVDRGQRSAVGTYGFQYGGLIVDGGRTPDESLGTLYGRLALPDEWRFVLTRPTDSRGLAGANEVEAFAKLPAVAEAVTNRLWQIAIEDIVPAVENADCGTFSEAVYQFGRLAGECFASAQGGPFASPTIERLVGAIRDRGVNGAGQSSWGPTVFAITPNRDEAARLAKWIQNHAEYREWEISIARPNNCGARISDHASRSS
jgi:beta-RFAP synthase